MHEVSQNAFLGQWKVFVRNGSLQEVSIERNGDKYAVTFDGTDPSEWHYDPEGGSLCKEQRTAAIYYWRNPGTDVLFSYDRLTHTNLWAAKRAVGPSLQIPIRCLGKTWKITASTGPRARPQDSFVQVRELSSGEGFPSPLYGLHHRDGKNGQWILYDVLAFNGVATSFTSIFRVRSLAFLEGSPTTGHDLIFATFDGRSILPAGHFSVPSPAGSGFSPVVGGLLPIERSIAAAAGERDEDPDTGVWVGEPGG